MNQKNLLSLFALYLVCGSSASDIDPDAKYVTYGSAVKLGHVANGGKYYLTSASQNMASGSGQQIVTLSPKKSDVNSLWIVRVATGAPISEAGTPVKCGQKIRLSHPTTQKNLHSHLVRSPLGRQQEVSAFGSDMEGDSGDDWVVSCSAGHDGFLERGKKFSLRHADTNRVLGADKQFMFNAQNCGGGCPIINHIEAHCRSSESSYTTFTIELGVHLSK